MAGQYRYRKVAVRTWDDEWFTGLSPIPPCGQGLWLYLLTGRETCTIPGLLRVGEAGLAEILGWPLEAFREAFREVSADGHVVADWRRRIVWVPSALRYNPPESPNVVLSWRLPWGELPECDLKRRIFIELQALVEGIGKGNKQGFVEALRKALVEPSGLQEQEQEQEPEEEERPEPSRRSAPVRRSPLPLFPEPGPVEDGPVEPPEAPTFSSDSFTDRQREALAALGEIPFRVVRWTREEGTVAEVLGRLKAHELARDLGGDGFPAIPVRQTVAQAANWTRSNPTKAKTPGGLRRFLTDWFAREQNRGGPRTNTGAPPMQPPAPRRGGDLLAKVDAIRKEDSR